MKIDFKQLIGTIYVILGVGIFIMGIALVRIGFGIEETKSAAQAITLGLSLMTFVWMSFYYLSGDDN